MGIQTRRDIVYLALAGFFVTNAILGELTGGKLFTLGPFTLSIGVIPWPVVFIATDLINEYFGREGVRRLYLDDDRLDRLRFCRVVSRDASAGGFVLTGFRLELSSRIWPVSVDHRRQCDRIRCAAELVDVGIFWLVRHKTGGRYLWMRATGSTVISQLIDSIVIIGIAFWLPGKIQTAGVFNCGGIELFF